MLRWGLQALEFAWLDLDLRRKGNFPRVSRDIVVNDF